MAAARTQHMGRATAAHFPLRSVGVSLKQQQPADLFTAMSVGNNITSVVFATDTLKQSASMCYMRIITRLTPRRPFMAPSQTKNGFLNTDAQKKEVKYLSAIRSTAGVPFFSVHHPTRAEACFEWTLEKMQQEDIAETIMEDTC